MRSRAWIGSATMPAASSVYWLVLELQKVNSPRLTGAGVAAEGHLALCGLASESAMTRSGTWRSVG